MVNSKLTAPRLFAKLLLILVIGAVSCILISRAMVTHAAGVVSVSAQPSASSVAIGDSFNVIISLNPNGNSVSAAELKVGYDATALQGVSISAGSPLPVVLVPGTIGGGSATIVLGANPNGAMSSTGTIATLSFKALKSGSTGINLNGTVTNSVGLIGNTVGTLNGTNVNIAGPTQAPTPSPAPTAPPTSVATPKPTPGPTQAPDVVNLTMNPGSLTTTVGGTVSLKINMDTSTDKVSAAELHLKFDKTKLQAQSITAGSFLPLVLVPGSVNNNDGTASIILGVQPQSPASGVGTVAIINFKALSTGLTSVSFDPTTQTNSVGKTGNTLSTLSGSDLKINALSTPTPTPTVTPSPIPQPQQTVTFDDKVGQNTLLNGIYPQGVVNWGSGHWFLSGPWGKFNTKSVSFTSGVTSRSFDFIGANYLVSLDAFNGGNATSTVTLNCPPNPTKTFNVAVNQLITIATGWTTLCPKVTVTSSNGWNTNFDNLKLSGTPGTSSPTPMPTPTKDTTRPVVAITNPSQGALVVRSTVNNPSVVSIKADASDNVGVRKVVFYVNGVARCSDMEAPYQCDWKVPANLRVSIYTLSVIAFDRAGNLATDNISVMAK